jgi:hypothetical protein
MVNTQCSSRSNIDPICDTGSNPVLTAMLGSSQMNLGRYRASLREIDKKPVHGSGGGIGRRHWGNPQWLIGVNHSL